MPRKYDFSSLAYLRENDKIDDLKAKKSPERKIDRLEVEMIFLISSLAETLNVRPAFWYNSTLFNCYGSITIFSATVMLSRNTVKVGLVSKVLDDESYEYSWELSIFGAAFCEVFKEDEFDVIKLRIIDILSRRLR